MSPISQQQAQMLSTAQLPASQASNQQPPKGSIVTGYPIRTQANTNYQPPASQVSQFGFTVFLQISNSTINEQSYTLISMKFTGMFITF